MPELLALNADNSKEDNWFSWLSQAHGAETIRGIADEVIREMEDGVYSRTEFRKIFAGRYKPEIIDSIFSSWGGIFVCLARLGKVAFRDMASRDFDLISAESSQTFDEVLPGLLRRYFSVYGPATFADASWFFGIGKEDAKKLPKLSLDDLSRFEYNGKTYYCSDDKDDIGDIPELTLLSGFDPIISSYTTDDRLCLPQGHKSKVILKSGICLPTVAVNGQVAGIWNIKKNAPVIEFFDAQPKRLKSAAFERVESIIERMSDAEDESIK